LFLSIFGLLGVDLVFEVPGFGIQERRLFGSLLFDVFYYLCVLGFKFFL
jgi:hypothetical protein